MNKVIEVAIEAVALLRGLEIEEVKQLLRLGNEEVKNEVFKLSCVALAVAN